MQPSAKLQQRLKDLQRPQETVITTIEVQEASLALADTQATPSLPTSSTDTGNACLTHHLHALESQAVCKPFRVHSVPGSRFEA